jgi:uncharacterized protein
VTLPTPEEIRALHREVAPDAEAFELVYTHCEIVWAVAAELIAARGPAVDADLVRAGCLLHDVGVHLLGGSPYIRHGVLGEELLLSRGFPPAVARFCGHHTGVGITRDDVRRQELPLPLGDYLADSGEERLVMYADKFHTKSTPPVFVTTATYRKSVSRFGGEHVARFSALVEEFGEPDLEVLARKYGHAVV